MLRIRPVWLIPITVIVIVAAVPEFRRQAIAQWQLVPLPNSPSRRIYQIDEPAPGGRSLALDAARFVELNHPDDPEMLTAAGIYMGTSMKLFERKAGASDVTSPPRDEARQRALSMLKRATEAGGGPVAWAAYAGALVAQVRCNRVAGAGVDPEDAEAISEVKQEMATAEAEYSTTSEEPEIVLEALQGWRQADPTNGMPVALEGYVVYGLRRDAEALGRWKEASRFSLVTGRQEQVARDVVGLVRAIGLPELEATVTTLGAASEMSIGWSEVRTCARIAVYEGRLAQIEGQRDDAVELWNATIEFGRHMQESADDMMSFLVGSAVANIGAGPAWGWLPDEKTGTTSGPLRDGRLWNGPQHEFYVSQVGERADAELRDSLTASKVRMKLAMDRVSVFEDEYFGEFARAIILPRYGFGMAVLTAGMMLAYLVATLWAWRKGDDLKGPLPVRTGGVGPAWLHKALVLGGTLIMYAYVFKPLMMWIGGILVCTALVLLVATGIRYRRRRLPRLPLRTELRRNTPSVAAVAALVYLATVVMAAHVRPRVAQKAFGGEMSRIVELLGEEWRSPSIPPDSWRAEYPPELPAQ